MGGNYGYFFWLALPAASGDMGCFVEQFAKKAVRCCLRFEVGLNRRNSKGGIMLGGLLQSVLGLVTGLVGGLFSTLSGLL